MSAEWTPERVEPDPRETPMFQVAAPIPPKVTRRETSNAKPVWTRYKVRNPVKCDDCMFLIAMAKGNAPRARFALFRRKQGDRDLLLCEIHAQYRRDEDGLKRYERKSL